eukprot:GHVP01032060.1.p1 GENE.GHVP01032060.1~~GHVP01032060.1.p1  ORF type:complete len:518 (+),score=101.77 GHVP01032060.1:663-2216(+)
MENEAMTKYFRFVSGQMRTRCEQILSEAKVLRRQLKDRFLESFNDLEYRDVDDRLSKLHVDVLNSTLAAIGEVFNEHCKVLTSEFGNTACIQFFDNLREEASINFRVLTEMFLEDREIAVQKISKTTLKSDARKLDAILRESALYLRREAQFENFVLEKKKKISNASDNELLNDTKPERKAVADLAEFYTSVEKLFLEISLKRAINETDEILLDEPDKNLTSTLPDDIFFIVWTSIKRGIHTSNLHSSCCVTATAFNLMSKIVVSQLRHSLTSSLRKFLLFVQESETLEYFDMLNFLCQADPAKKKIPKLASSHSWIHAANNTCQFLVNLQRLEEESLQEYKKIQNCSLDDANFNVFAHALKNPIQTLTGETQKLVDMSGDETYEAIKQQFSQELLSIVSCNFLFPKIRADNEVETRFASFLDSARIVFEFTKKYFESRIFSRVFAKIRDEFITKMKKLPQNRKFNISGAQVFQDNIKQTMQVFITFSNGESVHSQFRSLLEMAAKLCIKNSEDTEK